MDQPATPPLGAGREEEQQQQQQQQPQPQPQQQRFCNLRCAPGHDCVLFAAGSFRCLRAALRGSLPAGANCRDPPQTDYSVGPGELRCAQGLTCLEGYCQYPCPPCAGAGAAAAEAFPGREPAPGGGGCCGSRADCGGGAAWTCTSAVCAPPWTPGAPRPTTSAEPERGGAGGGKPAGPPGAPPADGASDPAAAPGGPGPGPGCPGPAAGDPPGSRARTGERDDEPPATLAAIITAGGPASGPRDSSAASLGAGPLPGHPGPELPPKLVPRTVAGAAAAPSERGAATVGSPHQVRSGAAV
ncbi:MAG: hypothetical protein BJ554DRAFT_4577 [Olpidium bornovanus]|uniref:Uncharacterized protein n=1 Tax=Olpidium bornovanus TaxID=278681 RepID=A0A8H7ZMK9_9FUNG|nr:MAG: hypothetical protein BJ554DRAFT_4577 [Olpidium bornovanus]